MESVEFANVFPWLRPFGLCVTVTFLSVVRDLGFAAGLFFRRVRDITWPGANHVRGFLSAYPGHTIPAARHLLHTGWAPSHTSLRRRHSQHCCRSEGVAPVVPADAAAGHARLVLVLLIWVLLPVESGLVGPDSGESDAAVGIRIAGFGTVNPLTKSENQTRTPRVPTARSVAAERCRCGTVELSARNFFD